MIVDVICTASYLNIRRICKLPYPGQVLVKEGMDVKPGDIIAEAKVPAEVMMLDISKGLGITPEETSACLIREVDENLEQGDVIAQCEKTLPRIFRAPVDGRILSYQKGQMALSTKFAKATLHANMVGKIAEVVPEYGAVISVQGSLIQGVWGNGRSGIGQLHAADIPIDKPLTGSVLDDLTSEHVLAGGLCQDSDFLEACESKEIAGLILGTIAPDLIPKVQSFNFPVILLLGFGETAPAEDLFDLLTSSDGMTVVVNACLVDHFAGKRPEIIIPKEEGNSERELGFRKKLEVGDQVRIISSKANHRSGKVVQLFENDQLYDNNLAFPTALVKLQSMEKIKVPQQNLVVIG